jgi:hypothetical protein
MFKVTPNPPQSDPTSPYESLDSKKLHEAADRALDHYLKPPIPKATKRKPSTIYHVGAKVDNETLLVNACESLASASVMLGELAVNQALDNVVPVE